MKRFHQRFARNSSCRYSKRHINSKHFVVISIHMFHHTKLDSDTPCLFNRATTLGTYNQPFLIAIGSQ